MIALLNSLNLFQALFIFPLGSNCFYHSYVADLVTFQDIMDPKLIKIAVICENSQDDVI